MIRFLQSDSRIVKVIFGVFITVVVVFMVITLIPGIFQDAAASTDNYATVRSGGIFNGRFFSDSREVSKTQVDRMAQMVLRQRHYPDMYLPFIEPQIGQRMIQDAMLLTEADRLGLRVSNEDIARELHTGQWGEVLFPGGNYIGDEQYTNFVANNFGMTKEAFETELKKEMELSRLQAYVTGGIVVPDSEVRESYRKDATKVKFDYAVLNADDVRKQINPTDAELETFFKQNAARYAKAVPETRKIQYAAFNLNQVPGSIQVTPNDIQAYYSAHQDQYAVKDQVKVRHILVKVAPGADAAADGAAKAKAADLLKQIKAGGDFAKLARENSDDPGSKDQGGELGFLAKGATVPPFEQAAFSLKPGQTSDLVKTQFGYHILQVEEKQTAHVKPLDDELRNQIGAQLTGQKQQQAAQTYATQLATEAAKTSLQKTADAHHLQVVSTDYLQGGAIVPGVADGAQLVEKAFAAKPNGAPDTASTGEGFAVFQVADVHAAHAPAFADWKSHLVQDYTEQQAPQLLQQKTLELSAKAHTENDLKKAAKELGATVKTSDLVDKSAQVPELGALTGDAAVAFTLNPGQISGPIVTARSGAVLQILDKQQPTDADIAKNFDQTRDQIVSQRRSQVFAVFASTLNDRYTKEGRIRMSKASQANSPLSALGGGKPRR